MARRRPVDALEGLLQGYEGTYLDCRNLGHVWTPQGYYRDGGQVRRLLACARCDTQRTDRWTMTGTRVSASYEYRDGYRIESEQPVTASAIRVEMLRRATVFASEAQMLEALTDGA